MGFSRWLRRCQEGGGGRWDGEGEDGRDGVSEAFKDYGCAWMASLTGYGTIARDPVHK